MQINDEYNHSPRSFRWGVYPSVCYLTYTSQYINIYINKLALRLHFGLVRSHTQSVRVFSSTLEAATMPWSSRSWVVRGEPLLEQMIIVLVELDQELLAFEANESQFFVRLVWIQRCELATNWKWDAKPRKHVLGIGHIGKLRECVCNAVDMFVFCSYCFVCGLKLQFFITANWDIKWEVG